MLAVSPEQIIYALDLVGIAACSVAATILAQHKGMDIAGCILVSAVGAIGGGTLRDILLNRHPLFWMTDGSYVLLIIFTSLLVQVFFGYAKHIDKPLKFFDAVGLAAFTLIGIKVALSLAAPAWVAVLMGVITAVAGGLLRDIICNEIPLVLRREIYITASLLGALTFFVLRAAGFHQTVVDFSSIGLIFTVRLLALRYDWHLPSIKAL